MLLFCDTETTNKLDFSRPFTDPGQPRVVSIGLVAYSDDGSKEVGNFYAIIKPDGFVIDNESEAYKINGITQEMAMDCGIPIKTALNTLNQFAHKAKYIGFYNAQFDVAMIEGESRMKDMQHHILRPKTRCLKIAYTGLCKIPGQYGDYKWPKLEEAYEWMFGQKPVGAHNAMYDSMFTAHLAFAAVQKGLWSWEPEMA